ncbi:MAG: hypothetical protein ACR2NP_03695 [Pirellulaceae bacterium]
MSKSAAMTLGLVLIFFGAQLLLVKSWLLNPTATRIFNENFAENNASIFSSKNEANNNGGLLGGLFGSGSSASGVANSPPRSSNPGQSWPYYQTDNASYSSGNGVFSNGSYQRTTTPGLISDPAVGRMDTTGRQLVVLPRWFMWPVLFLGAIFFLYGVSLR